MTRETIEQTGVTIAGSVVERRISWLTPPVGLAAGAAAALLHRWDWAAGLAIGAALAWLNFFWLRRGIQALVTDSVSQEGREKPRVSLWTYFAAAFRYALIALAVYVIFIYLHVPLVSLLVGLCALGAATIAASVWEAVHPVK
jgi:small-conductance mechanosensitive channel